MNGGISIAELMLQTLFKNYRKEMKVIYSGQIDKSANGVSNKAN